MSNTEPKIHQPQPLIFTDNAALKVHQLLQEENDPELMLRVYIQGGGCSGFQYGFNFEEEKQADDITIEKPVTADPNASPAATVKLIVDPMSLQYLMGAEIDFVADINGEQFVIRNPNAKTTCGCGSSFAID